MRNMGRIDPSNKALDITEARHCYTKVKLKIDGITTKIASKERDGGGRAIQAHRPHSEGTDRSKPWDKKLAEKSTLT